MKKIPTITSITLEQITKEQAAALLARNLPNNRPLSARTVARYRKLMDAGQWAPSPDAVVCVDLDGSLLNGQHRLKAFEQSSLSVLQTFVARGVPTAMALVFDQGRRRTPGNQLAMLGYENAVLLAATARKLWFYLANGGPSFGGATDIVTTADIVDVVKAHSPALQRCVTAAATFYTASKRLLPPTTAATLMYLFGRVDENARSVFFTTLETGRRTSRAVAALREILVDGRAGRQRLWGNSAVGEALLIKAWNAWRAGDVVGLLTFHDGEDFPSVHGLVL